MMSKLYSPMYSKLVLKKNIYIYIYTHTHTNKVWS